MYSLLIANIPHDCEVAEIQTWIETCGIRVLKLKLIPDLVSRSSPSFAQVQLKNAHETEQAARLLDGQPLRQRTVRVKALTLSESHTPVLQFKARA